MNNTNLDKRLLLYILLMGLAGGAIGYATRCQDGSDASCQLSPTSSFVSIAQGVFAGVGAAIGARFIPFPLKPY